MWGHHGGGVLLACSFQQQSKSGGGRAAPPPSSSSLALPLLFRGRAAFAAMPHTQRDARVRALSALGVQRPVRKYEAHWSTVL